MPAEKRHEFVAEALATREAILEDEANHRPPRVSIDDQAANLEVLRALHLLPPTRRDHVMSGQREQIQSLLERAIDPALAASAKQARYRIPLAEQIVADARDVLRGLVNASADEHRRDLEHARRAAAVENERRARLARRGH